MVKNVSPSTMEEVQSIVQIASQQKESVYVYRPADPEGVKLDLTELKRIIEIDTANLVATVEAGVTFNQLSVALQEQGLRFVPANTPFYQEKTIGQFYYEGCSNIASLKYGFAKHLIMGSENVLATGELLKVGGKTVKNVTGYDMTRFMNSPYMNCAVAVKFLLKLLPQPEIKKRFILQFPDLGRLFEFIAAMRQAKVVPVYMVWADEKTQCFMQHGDTGKTQCVLSELDGIKEEVAEQWQVIAALAKNQRATVMEEAAVVNCEIKKWADLYSSAESSVMTDDLKFRYTDEMAFISQFYALTISKKKEAGLFGQIAEGKLHICFGEQKEDREEFIQAVLAIATNNGGFVSGKWRRMTGKIPNGPMALVEEGLKKLFDPSHILKG